MSMIPPVGFEVSIYPDSAFGCWTLLGLYVASLLAIIALAFLCGGGAKPAEGAAGAPAGDAAAPAGGAAGGDKPPDAPNITTFWCDMSTVSRNRSKPSVNPAPLELIARVREQDAQVKCLLDETKDIMKVHRESGSVSALVSKLFAQMRNLRNQSSADKKAKADVVSSRWQGDHNLLKKEKQCYNQEFKCCGRLHSVGKCECTTAHLDEQALNSWRLSACERILAAFVRYRDSARKFMTKDLLTKNVVDGVVDSVTKRRQSVANGLPLSAAMQQLQQTDENLLKSMIVNIISDFTNGQNKKPIPHLNCMFKTAVGGFLQNCSLDDLLWFTCKIMEAPWLGVDWIPSLLRKVILSHCDSNLKKGFESFCRFMFVVLEMSSLYAEPKGDPVEESESWVVVEPVLNQDTRCGPVSEETIRLYFNLLDVNGLGAFSEKIQSREQLTSLEKWTLYTSLTQYMVCLTEATLKKFVDRRCYDTAMYISLVTACWINWLYYVRNDLSGSLQSENDRSIAEEMYIRLSGYKVIVSVEKYTLWQSFLSMPIPLGEPIDEWRLLYVLFRQGKDEIADVMQMPLPRLKGLVRETVRNTKYGVHSNPEIVHFYNTVCAILERLKNPDTVSITILALLLRAFSSEDDIERVTFEKNMLSILLSSPLCAEQFIPAMDECLKRMPSANCANIINVLSFEHLRLNNKTWPILKSWLRHGVESKQFALAERIVAELGLGHYTLADDAFTAELVDVLSLLFRKHVTDCKLSKESIANKMSLSGSRNGRFEQFCWSIVACVKVTKRSKNSGQRRALRTFFPTKHSLFEAFVHFQSGNESEISVEDFLKAVTELRIPAAVLPCVIYLLRKFLEDETAVLPSAAKFREWMDCLLCSASDGLVEFPLPELFSHQLSQIIAEYKETKPSKCKDVTTFLFSTISPVRNAAWRQSSGHVPLMDSCSRAANTVGDGGYNFLSQLLFESGFTSSNEEVLKDLVKGFNCFKVTHARGHCSLKYPDIAFTYATKVHDYVMTMDSSVSERPIWRLAVGQWWCFICSTVCHHRLFLLLTSLRRLYEVVTSDESFTGRELNDLAADMVKFLESKNCQFLKVSRQQLYRFVLSLLNLFLHLKTVE
ncbi:hypothetical protein TTRE_0000822101 [Trichuris trichiura]|uniref:Uncharacterized protein n=1 Tax=Trichuris trichiura TaxID=36087 RepID=A0A077ZHM1_TRITR|nr:hypothetical protein TTRE_0000822101 [Trichuris trichiura]